MQIKYFLKRTDGLIVPKRANATDAGYDVVATSNPKIVGTVAYEATNQWKAIDYVEYETNLYFVPDDNAILDTPKTTGETVFTMNANFHTDLRPRSSISSKTNFVLANSIGLIDRGYHNQVLVRFKYVWQPMDFSIEGLQFHNLIGNPNREKMYKKGDAIAQILPIQTNDINFQIVDTLPGEDRGGGFGSTDAKRAPAAPAHFQLKGKTNVHTYYRTVGLRGRPLVTEEWVTRELRHSDGDIYEYSDGNVSGLCVVDGSGQVLAKTKIFVL